MVLNGQEDEQQELPIAYGSVEIPGNNCKSDFAGVVEKKPLLQEVRERMGEEKLETASQVTPSVLQYREERNGENQEREVGTIERFLFVFKMGYITAFLHAWGII